MAYAEYPPRVLYLRNLRRIRSLKLMTQEELARRAEVSTNTISSIERGAAAQFGTVEKLCRVLEVSVEELVGDE